MCLILSTLKNLTFKVKLTFNFFPNLIVMQFKATNFKRSKNNFIRIKNLEEYCFQ